MKTLEEIYAEMTALFQQETGVTLAGDGDMAVRLYAAAAQIYALYVQADWVERQCFPQSALGEALDRHAQLRGLERRAAAAAQGVLRFETDSPAQADLTIPAGTVCMTAGLVRFATLEEAVIPAGESAVEAPAKAEETGAAGNAAAGSVRAMAVAPVGVSRCTNPAAFFGGVDEEDDEALRARVLESFKRMPNGANTAFYQQGALSFPEVAAAAVLPRNRGRGTVDVVVSTQAGLPGAELLAQLGAYFEARREIAVDVQVKAPELVSVDVSVAVGTKKGADAEAVCGAVEQAVSAWFSGSLLGQDVLLARLGALVFQVDGVANYRLSAPLEDVEIGTAQLPVLGELTVTQLEESA
ncbi:baseplate J/gp47 family protein [Lawsonibacter celer]|uniref:baseplate J/gp47 family protein n=1 Tax=Lawsonibacter celer TaxID=2986526 RepID=UPI0016474E6C|nr:baseplate J/gp47 family protein [Lawsonibacter celer]